MSLVKRHLELMEEQHAVATGIAVRAGVLDRCGRHDYVRDTWDDPANAYRSGNSMFTRGELGDTFASRRELTDKIKEVIEEAGDHSCPGCEKMLED